MRSLLRVNLLATLTIFGVTIPFWQEVASGTCVWTWDCSSGTCRQVPLCDSTLDIPPPQPPSIPPIAPPSIPPVEVPTIPPIGTDSCGQKYICDDSGNCAWQTVCQQRQGVGDYHSRYNDDDDDDDDDD